MPQRIARVLITRRYDRQGEQLYAYAADLAERLGVPVADERRTETRDAIRVAPSVRDPIDIPTLVPIEESAVLGRGAGPVVVPIGANDAWFDALVSAMPVLSALHCPTVLYHTTWKEKRVDSDDPRDHMCADARRMLENAQAFVRGAGLESDTVVEMANTIVDGLILHAELRRASLIVMARSRTTRKGSHVDAVLARSPIPVLVAG